MALRKCQHGLRFLTLCPALVIISFYFAFIHVVCVPGQAGNVAVFLLFRADYHRLDELADWDDGSLVQPHLVPRREAMVVTSLCHDTFI